MNPAKEPDKPTPAPDRFAEKPFVVFWELTRSCALACKHCRAEARVRPAAGELNTQEAFAVIDQLAEMRPFQVVLTGGDPLMRRDLHELLARGRDRGLNLALSPAATHRLVNCDFRQLGEMGIGAMSLSLDGPDQASHDAFRGLPGTFTRTLVAAHKAHAAGMRLQINTTLSAETVGRYADFKRLIKELAPHRWSLFALVPTGRASRDELPSPAATEALFKEILLDSDRKVPVGTTEAPHFRRVKIQLGRALQAPGHPVPPGIRDGRGILFISHLGEVHPSGFMPIPCGNVKTQSLAAIYRCHPLFRRLRDSDALEGKCGRCQYRTVCGGSRARAFAISGNPLGQDPLCPFQPN